MKRKRASNFLERTNGLVSWVKKFALDAVKHLLKRLFTRLPKICKSFSCDVVVVIINLKSLQDEVDSIPLYASSITKLKLELLGLLPSKALVGEVTVLSGLEVDGVNEVQLLDNDTGAEVEVLVDNLHKLVRGLLRGAVGLNEQGKRLGDTDSV